MACTLIWYPNCSTCKKAKKALEEAGLTFQLRHIVEDTPSKEELRLYWQCSGLALKKFFNTSGKLYKELQLKDRLSSMDHEEQLQLLSENGMLIKRPLLVCGDMVLVGFQEDKYKNLCSEC